MSAKHLSKGSKAPPSKGKIRIYSNRFCPFAQRVHLVLEAKKLQYETVYINLKTKPEWYHQKNPLEKIPSLELENGEIIYESLIVANYLDEKYSQNMLYPKDPLQKAKDCILIDQFGQIAMAMGKLLFFTGNPDDEKLIMDKLETFEHELAKRGQYFGGAKPGMVDYMIWPWCERAELLKHFGSTFTMKSDRYKNLLEWSKLMREDKAVRKTCLDIEIHTQFLQSHRAGIPEYDIQIPSQA